MLGADVKKGKIAASRSCNPGVIHLGRLERWVFWCSSNRNTDLPAMRFE